jgi:predicted ATP-grasp superfamily ATP-dependent carboligase
MQVQDITRMFSFTFEKTTKELIEACSKKEHDLRSKIEERVVRIRKMRDDHKITDAVLLDIQNQMRAQAKQGLERQSYTSNAVSNSGGHAEEVVVGAGVINFLLTEQDFIDGEKASADRMALIARNLRDVIAADGTPRYTHKVGYEELRFLGF